jgi:hypothetical protein
LLEDIGDSSVVVGLITHAALSSSWVLFELGATWGAKKNLKPLVTDEVDVKELPGSLSSQHVARLSVSSDIAQFVEEVATVVGRKRRAAAKAEKAIQDLVAAHAEYVKGRLSGGRDGGTAAKPVQRLFAGLPFEELAGLLLEESVMVPAALNEGKGDKKVPLLELFIWSARTLSGGAQSNWKQDTFGGFCYHEIGLRLLPYGFVQFEKVPPVHEAMYKRLAVSPEGHRFLLEVKRKLAKGNA